MRFGAPVAATMRWSASRGASATARSTPRKRMPNASGLTLVGTSASSSTSGERSTATEL